MIKKIDYYISGNPIDTGAVIELDEEIIDLKKDISEIEDFEVRNENSKINLKYNFKKNDMVIGFGQTMKGLNKRGSELISFCSDEPSHIPNKKSLYGAHNFFIIIGESISAYFIDFPGQIYYDVGFNDKDVFDIKIEGKDLIIYRIIGDSIRGLAEKFLDIIGESYAAPKWAFGYQQCRWSYETSSDIREVAANMRKARIPCDAIYLDIDYMERFKDFTTCKDKFPDFQLLVDDMKGQGFRLVPIIDAGVKIEEGYHVYEEGIKNSHFCLDKDGNPFTAAVWPGLVHFPDFFKEEASQWFGDKYSFLTDFGIDGFWNDMNEPAIFYTPNGLKKFYDHVEESKSKNLDIYSYFSLKDKALKLSNNMEDYRSFYHNLNGNLIRHDKVHNLYGYYMTKSAYEGLRRIDKNKRFLLFSRASYIGMHRYGGIWMGDNDSWWEHIELSIRMLPALNMCGFAYVGADTGGFGSDVSSELLIRFTQFSLFTPLMRNHAALGTRRQEPYAFEEESVDILRSIIELRYSLIPYLYSTFIKSIRGRQLYSSNLIMDYADPRVREIEDQLLIGKSIMIAPIYKQNKSGRHVYLPEKMMLWKAKNLSFDNLSLLEKGDHYIESNLDEIPIYIRPNKGLVIGKSAETVDKLDSISVHFLGLIDSKIYYEHYDDDGITRAYKRDENTVDVIEIIKEADKLKVKIEFDDRSKVKNINITIMDTQGVLYSGQADRENSAIILEKVDANEK